MLFSLPTKTMLLSKIQKRETNIFYIILILVLLILFFLIILGLILYFLSSLNIFSQFDLTTSTDNEDFANLASDVLEVSIKNKTMLLDFIFLPSMSFFSILTAYEFYKLFR